MRDISQPLAYTIPGAVEAAGITRSRLYELIGLGTLDARKAGRRTVITADSLRAYVDNLPPASIRVPRQKAAA